MSRSFVSTENLHFPECGVEVVWYQNYEALKPNIVFFFSDRLQNVVKRLSYVAVQYTYTVFCSWFKYSNKSTQGRGGVQSYIDSLVEFDNNPRDRKFTGIVYPPLCFNKLGKSKFLLAKVLIYSPYEQLELKLECPVHRGVYLKPCR